jgi:hypothetical protein
MFRTHSLRHWRCRRRVCWLVRARLGQPSALHFQIWSQWTQIMTETSNSAAAAEFCCFMASCRVRSCTTSVTKHRRLVPVRGLCHKVAACSGRKTRILSIIYFGVTGGPRAVEGCSAADNLGTQGLGGVTSRITTCPNGSAVTKTHFGSRLYCLNG